MNAHAHLLSRRHLLAAATTTVAAGAVARAPVSALGAPGVSERSGRVFATAEEIYSTLGAALKDLVSDPAGERLRSLDALVAIEVFEPEAQIVLALNSRPPAVEFAKSQFRAGTRVAVSGDLLHALAVGRLTISEAIFDPDLTWTGDSVRQLQGLVALPAEATPFYRRSLASAGLADLIPESDPPVFRSSEHLYKTLGRAIRETVLGRPEGESFRRVNCTIALRFVSPDSQINLRLTDDPEVSYGPGGGASEAVVHMTADVADRLFSGALGVTEAVGRGLLKYEGRTDRIARIAALPALVGNYYSAEATDQGGSS